MDKIKYFLLEKDLSFFGNKKTNIKNDRKDEIFYLNSILSVMGFIMSKQLIDYFSSLSIEDFKEESKILLDSLKSAYGGDKVYNKLFKGFPDEIPNSKEYFFSRILNHYSNVLAMVSVGKESLDGVFLSCGHYVYTELFDITKFGACPVCQCQVEELTGADQGLDVEPAQVTKTKLINLIEEKQVKEKAKNIIISKSSVSESELNFVEHVFVEFDGLENISSIPFKENMAFYCSLFLKNNKGINYNFETITDILRVANVCSGGDVYLLEKGNFKFKRSLRKVFLKSIEELKQKENNIVSDMFGYRSLWLAFGEKIHVGEYKSKFPKAFNYFDILRNKKLVGGFNQELEVIIENIRSGTFKTNGDSYLVKSVKFVATKPGVLARYLDFFLRFAKNKNERDQIVDIFANVVNNLQIKTLLELESYFDYFSKNERFENRHFVPKGLDSKIVSIKEDRKALNKTTCKQIVKIVKQEVLEKMSNNEFIEEEFKDKKVYLDNSLKSILIPFSMRDSSGGTMSLERGSRVPVAKNSDYVRVFTYWKEKDCGRVDVDISAAFLNENFEYVSDVSYYSYGHNYAHFSGDIQSAPKGAAEFIDLDLKKIEEIEEYRYIILNNFSYTGQPFSDFECISGVMELDKSSFNNKKPTFQLNNVKFKVDAKKKSRMTSMFVYDIKNREMIWLDSSMKVGVNTNAANSSSKVRNVFDFALNREKVKPNIYSLFLYNLKSNSIEVVKKKKDADIVLDEDYCRDTSVILSQWL